MSSRHLVGEVLGAGEVEDVVFGWAPEATIGARSSSPSARVTPTRGRRGRRSRRPRRRCGSRRPPPRPSGDRLGDRAHPADHVAPGARDPVELPERVVEQVVGGARGVRAGPDADHAGRGDRALERVVLEPVVEQVGDRHREDADQVVDVAAAEPGGARALAQQREQVARGASSPAPAARAAASGGGTSRPGRAAPRSPRRPRRRAWRRVRSRPGSGRSRRRRRSGRRG